MYDKGKFEIETPAPVRELDDVSRRLLRAAEIIRERGWCQGALERNGAHCVLGAINFASSGNYMDRDGIGQDAFSRLGAHLKVSCQGVVSWNNAPRRTASEVIAALEAAAFANPANGVSGPSHS